MVPAVRYSRCGIAGVEQAFPIRRGDLMPDSRRRMIHRHGQNVIAGDDLPAAGFNCFNYDSRFLFVGILKEIGVHLATKEAVSDNVKRAAQTTNLKLLLPVVASVGSQSH